jgi:ketosteroid isomerase-like protein
MMKRLALMLLCASIVAPASSAGDAEAAIRAANSRLKEIVLSGKADAVVTDFYAPGAILMPPDSPLVKGDENVKAIWNGLAALGKVTLDVQSDSVEEHGDTAIETGRWTLEIVMPGHAQPTKDKGKYIVVWKRQKGGEWRASHDIWNSDSPPPSAPK